MDPVIEKNLARWNAEQAAKREKRERNRALAVSTLKAKLDRAPKEHEIRAQVKYILSERRSKWLLKNCRATIGEIVLQHQPKEVSK